MHIYDHMYNVTHQLMSPEQTRNMLHAIYYILNFQSITLTTTSEIFQSITITSTFITSITFY